MKQNNYIKLPTYVIDVKRFYPYIKELSLNILKFKGDIVLKANGLLNNMKEKFIHSAQVKNRETNVCQIRYTLRINYFKYFVGEQIK